MPLEPLTEDHNNEGLSHASPVLAGLRQEALKGGFGIASLDLSGSTQMPKFGRSFSVVETFENAGHVGAISPQRPCGQTALPRFAWIMPQGEHAGGAGRSWRDRTSAA